MTTNPLPMSAEVSTSELELEHWPLQRLMPYARNARTHSKAQIEEIAASIRANGFRCPLLVSEQGEIIAGHGRLAAAQLLELASVPVIKLRGLTDVQRRQLVIADNRIAQNAGWNAELLRLELNDLKTMGADLSILGFGVGELERLLGDTKQGLTDEDELPPLADRPVSRAGDIWLLGEHRVLCGDATDRNAVALLLEGSTSTLMVTDPPYGVSYDTTWRHRAGVNKSRRRGKVANDDRADWGAAWAHFPGRIAYVWHGALHATTVARSLEENGFAIRSQIIWAKERLVIGRGDYHWQHEPCWYAVRDKGNWTGDRKQTTLWAISSRDQDAETVHGTQKPVECMRRPMLNNSQSGDTVYDPFVGSGTSIIAGESINRRVCGLEIDPRYVDVSIRRWEAFTGASAVLHSSGKAFAEVVLDRGEQEDG